MFNMPDTPTPPLPPMLHCEVLHTSGIPRQFEEVVGFLSALVDLVRSGRLASVDEIAWKAGEPVRVAFRVALTPEHAPEHVSIDPQIERQINPPHYGEVPIKREPEPPKGSLR